VDDGMKELEPLYESPSVLLRRNGLPTEGASGVVEALDRRHRAKEAVLHGLMLYYGAIAASEPERHFLDALRIDPGDRTAIYYLRQIAEKKTSLYVRWGEYEDAEAMLDSFTEVLPDEPLFPLMLGDVYYARERFLEARESYARHLSLGGNAARAAQRAHSQTNVTGTAGDS